MLHTYEGSMSMEKEGKLVSKNQNRIKIKEWLGILPTTRPNLANPYIEETCLG